MAGRVITRQPTVLPTGFDVALVKSLRDSADPLKAYEALLSGQFLKSPPSASTWVEVARVLFEKGKPDLGERALSNLLETTENGVEAARAMAYWLAEFGEKDRAARLLDRLARRLRDPATGALAAYDAGSITDDTKFFRQAVEASVKAERPDALPTVALTDYFGRGGLATDGLRRFTAKAMPSDVRVVVSHAGGAVGLEVKEPGVARDVDERSPSPHGGRIDTSPRVIEYQMKNGLPGTYEFTCRRLDRDAGWAVPISLRVTIYTRWAKEGQTSKTRTYIMEGPEIKLDGVEFSWGK